MKEIDYKQIVNAIRTAMVDYEVNHQADEQENSQYVSGKVHMAKWVIGLIDKGMGKGWGITGENIILMCEPYSRQTLNQYPITIKKEESK